MFVRLIACEDNKMREKHKANAVLLVIIHHSFHLFGVNASISITIIVYY